MKVAGFIVISLLLIGATVYAQDVTPIPPIPEEPVVNLDEAAQGAVDATQTAAQAAAQTANDLITRLMQRPQSEVLRALFVIGGVVLLFFGWRIYEYIIVVAGFLIGGAIALVSIQKPVCRGEARLTPTQEIWFTDRIGS